VFTWTLLGPTQGTYYSTLLKNQTHRHQTSIRIIPVERPISRLPVSFRRLLRISTLFYCAHALCSADDLPAPFVWPCWGHLYLRLLSLSELHHFCMFSCYQTSFRSPPCPRQFTQSIGQPPFPRHSNFDYHTLPHRLTFFVDICIREGMLGELLRDCNGWAQHRLVHSPVTSKCMLSAYARQAFGHHHACAKCSPRTSSTITLSLSFTITQLHLLYLTRPRISTRQADLYYFLATLLHPVRRELTRA
jgi:hypothetical protein